MYTLKNILFLFSALEPGIFTQEIAGFGTAVNTTYQKEELFKQFRWNLICGSYLTQGE